MADQWGDVLPKVVDATEQCISRLRGEVRQRMWSYGPFQSAGLTGGELTELVASTAGTLMLRVGELCPGEDRKAIFVVMVTLLFEAVKPTFGPADMSVQRN